MMLAGTLKAPGGRPTWGVTVSLLPKIGLGDAVQFSSLPENYFRSTGEKLVDLSRHWIFDHNPFVIREEGVVPRKSIVLWNFGHRNKWRYQPPRGDRKPGVYLSNAEIWAAAIGAKVYLNRPRLYVHEDFPFEQRKMVLLHANGKSHGQMPEHVLEHVKRKYGPTGELFQVGLDPVPGIPHIKTESIWELAEVVSKSRIFIGVDSGPSWIAACYPDVVTKILRTKPTPELFQDWVPLDPGNVHSHWDDRCRQIFNPSDVDVGFTSSYRRI